MKTLLVTAILVLSLAGGAHAASPAVCGPGDRPEPGLQGQVPKAVQGNESLKGFWCGMHEVGHSDLANRGANYGHAWIGDCAYVTQFNGATDVHPSGLAVVDVADPRNPRLVRTSQSEGSLQAVETVHAREGGGRRVLVAGAYDQNKLDVYDATDCRNPKLMTTFDVPHNIHNVTVSWDTRTVWIGTALPISDANQPQQHIVAVDITDLANPKVVATQSMAEFAPEGANPSLLGVHRVDVSRDGTRIYAGMISGSVFLPVAKPFLAEEGDLAILDSSDVQARKPGAELRFISQVDGSWHGPRWFKRGGRTYLVSGDEAITNTAPASYCGGPFPTIADITDEAAPVPIGAFELEINRRENCPQSIEDESLYSTHYTDVDDQEDARLGLFPMYNSGLRVADLSDPAHPKEVGYFNPPPDLDTAGGATYHRDPQVADLTPSNVRYRPETGHIWFVSMTSGFHVVELTGTGPAKDLGLPPAAKRKKCRRALRIRLPRRLQRAAVFVNGRRVKRVRGRDLRVPVVLRKLPRGKVRVRIVARDHRGRRVVRKRTYRGC